MDAIFIHVSPYSATCCILHSTSPLSCVSCLCASFFVPDVCFLHQDRIIVPRIERLAPSRNTADHILACAPFLCLFVPIFASPFLHLGPTPVDFYEPTHVFRRWLSCILSTNHVHNHLCTIPRRTIPGLSVLALGKNTLAVLYLIPPHGRN